MKRVLVHGYFRANLGDDLFFRVLAMRYPDVQFYLPTTRCDYREMFKDLPNVRIIDFLQIARLTSRKIYMLPKLYSWQFMKRFDAVVCIGGSLFIDRQNPTSKDRIEAEQYSFICDWEYAKAAGVPYFVLGANWGPCYNDYFFDYFNRAFDSLADLYFRDRASFEMFAQKPAVRWGGDILMAHPAIRAAGSGLVRKKQIAVSVVEPGSKHGTGVDAAGYYRAVGAVCRDFQADGYDVKLLSFCKDEGDEEACRRVLEELDDHSRVETVCYSGDWKQMLAVIGASERMLATRFHGTVLGWTLGVPVYSIAYSNKTLNLIADCGVQDSCIPMTALDKLNADAVRKHAVIPADPGVFSGAEAAFVRLDKLLK